MEQAQENLHPYRDYQMFPPQVLQELRQEAAATGDINGLELVLEEARSRDRWDDTEPVYAHLVEDCMNDLRRFGAI